MKGRKVRGALFQNRQERSKKGGKIKIFGVFWLRNSAKKQN